MSPETPGPEAPPLHENRFFGWLRSTGIRRQPGWIGGVCAGIAERIGIDPLIVRGIVVVVAVLGGPAILLYAAAWLLLPDRFDVIHLEELFRGRVSGALAAIAGLIVLSMLPVTQGFWSAGAAFWDGGVSFGRIAWTVVLLGALVAVIVWLSRRGTPPTDRADATSAASGDPTATGGSRSFHQGAANTAHHGAARASASAATAAAAAAATGDPNAASPTARPARPGADATHEDFAAWRDQQAAWKAERAAFQAQELASIREMNLARSKERREAAQARAAEDAARRRAWDRANPALSGALVAITIGLAALAGGVAALIASATPGWNDSEVAAGLGTATVLVGVAIVAAGAFGRRNGFLIFLSVVLLIATLLAAVVPNNRQLVGVNFSTAGQGRFTQLAGQLGVYVDGTNGGTVDLWQGSGTTEIEIPEGRTVRVELVSLDQRLTVTRDVSADYVPSPDEDFAASGSGVPQSVYEYPQLTARGGEYHYAATIGPGAVPDETVRLWQGNGNMTIIDHNVKATGK